MADNIDVTPGTGKTVAADEIGGVLHQRVKISQGADGSATDVSSAAPLQVTLANTGANATPVVVDNSGVTQPISGIVTANLSATDNAVLDQLELNQDAQTALLTMIDADTSALAGAVAGTEVQVDIVSSALPTGAATAANQQTDALTDTQLRATAVPVSGTVTANLSATDNAVLDQIELNQDSQTTLLTAIDADTSTVNTNSVVIAAGFAAEGAALGSGVLLQGDDGTDRKNVNVDATTGDVQVDVTNTVTVDGSGVTQPVSHAALTELAAAINSNLVDVNIVSGAGSGGTAQADDADFTAGTTQGTPSMGVYESTPSSVTDGDLGTVGITSGRRLKTSATIDAALPAGTNNIGDVDVLSSALPTGAATSAKQDTIIGHVDGIETVLGTIDTDTGGIATSTASIDTKTPALGQALAAASVPVVLTAAQLTTLTPVSTVTANIGTVATLATAAKQDTGNASLSSIDGKITAVNTGAVVISSGNVTADTELTTADLDTGAGTDTRAVVGLVGSKSGGGVLIPGDATAGLKVDLGADNDVTVTGTVAISGTVAVTQSGTWDEVGINDSGNSITVDNGGTFATQVDGSALTALQLIDDPVFADDAAYTLSTSKGNVVEGVAVQTDGTDPTAVSAEGDAAALRTDMQRNLIVNQTHPRFWHVSADYASAQTNASVKAAPGASLSLYITDIQISNGATAGNITLLDGSGGTVLYELYAAITGGAVLSLRSPIKLTANTALCITSTTVTTHSVFVSGYVAP